MKYLRDIIPALNAAVEKTALVDFSERRRAITGGYRWSGGLLNVDVDAHKYLDGYAFHKGGLSELQFNAGFEDDGFFRYGVAFSIQPTQSVRDPVSTLRSKIRAFNAVLDEFPVLQTLGMWWYDHGERRQRPNVEPIPTDMIRTGVFIFIGERVPVGKQGVTPDMIARAAQVFSSLLPLYERVESFDEVVEAAATASAFKVARLCWNTNDWQSPTGRDGKVGNRNSFEGVHGFGHEEWLLDHGRLLDGWKYGFIQPLNRSFGKYAGSTLNLLLYTIDNRTKCRYWVASIRGVEVLTPEQASHTVRTFKKNGWLHEMRRQVRMRRLNDATLTVAKPQELLNLRYRPEHCTRFDPMIEFPANELPGAHYGNMQGVPKSQAGALLGATHADSLKERNLGKLKSTRNSRAEKREIDLVHKRWQSELKGSLKKHLPEAKITVETKIGDYWVDIVIDVGKIRILVELKTCSVVRQALREALSQLMEYAYRPPSGPRADILLIVCAGQEEAADREYMRMLRERFRIPVHYLQYREGVIVDIQRFVAQVTE
jgi:hypothetical protein